MLDIKFIRNNTDIVKDKTKKREMDPVVIDEIIEYDEKRRTLLKETEELKAERNTVSQNIAEKKRNKEDADADIQAMQEVGKRISEIDNELKEVEYELHYRLDRVPNLIDDEVPVGKDDSENVEVRRTGEQKTFDFELKAHWELLEELKMADFERASKVSGSRFVYLTGEGARLERALIKIGRAHV